MDPLEKPARNGTAPVPAIRNIELFPFEHEGETYFCASDPSGMVEQQLMLSVPAAVIASQLDGVSSLSDIRAALVRQFPGATVSLDEVSAVVDQFDTAGFLHTKTFRAIQRELVSTFNSTPTRGAYHAGRSYPADPDALRQFLNEQFLRPGGPGCLPDGECGSKVHRGMIVPHIDLPRGGHAYAHGYLDLYRSGRPDTVIIFGVAHAAEPVPFILTRKPFETPLGTLRIDEEILNTIERACDFDPYGYEFTHRSEHSIEFQAVMLAHLYGTDVKIVPILTSYFWDEPHEVTDGDPVSRFLGACREAIVRAPYPVTVLGGADLAHVGRRFGDAVEIDDSVLADIRKRDEEDMEHAYRMAPEAFYASVMADDNARHVCGHNCVYSTVKVLEGLSTGGRLLHYDCAMDPAGGVVSFASAAFARG